METNNGVDPALSEGNANYAAHLRDHLAQRADPAAAAQMSAYMKNLFPFFGIKSPVRDHVTRDFIAEHGTPPIEQLESVVAELWLFSERECQYAALDLIERSLENLPTNAMPWIESLIVTKSWWDTVDRIASHIVGSQLQRFPELGPVWIGRWRDSENMWLRRTTLLFQLGYKTKTDAALLFSLIEQNATSREFFIQKAIGWALREFSKTDPTAVAPFVESASLAPLSRREALKWLAAHPVEER